MSDISHIKLTYFDWHPRGLGENVKLLLDDAGISHEYILIPSDKNWPGKKAQLIKDGLPFGTLPVIELPNGKKYDGSIAIMRFLSKKLGKYLATNEDDEQFLDCAEGCANDWITQSYLAIFGVESQKEHYIKEEAARHYGRFDIAYGARGGPYILGEEITFVDFLVYHIIDGDGRRRTGLEKYPHLANFIKVFEERPNLKEHIAGLILYPTL